MPAEPMRSSDEAWQIVLDNKGLLISIVNRFMKDRYLAWYSQEAFRDELDSIAYEAFHRAALEWDPDRGSLATYTFPVIWNDLQDWLNRSIKMGGNYRSGGGKATKTEGYVKVFSLQDYGSNDESTVFNHIEEELPNIFQLETEDNTFEDDLLDRLYEEQFFKDLEEILGEMDMEHEDIFRAVHPIGEGVRENPKLAAISKAGGGLSIAETAKLVGRNKKYVTRLLEEAREYVVFQLMKRGYGEEYDV